MEVVKRLGMGKDKENLKCMYIYHLQIFSEFFFKFSIKISFFFLIKKIIKSYLIAIVSQENEVF